MKKFLLIFGTRPELIKLTPIIYEFERRNLRDSLFVVNSNQHTDLLKNELDFFGIRIDYQFQMSRDCNDLSLLNGLLMSEFYKLKKELSSSGITLNSIIAQGDTATTFCAALFSFYEHIPFAHVEAGLRTYDFNHPFPEEFYRKTISSITSFHFSPTQESRLNLISEGSSSDSILVTGNTVIDMLKKQLNGNDNGSAGYRKNGLILITIHRRENQLGNFEAICRRIVQFCEDHPERRFIWISHPTILIRDFIQYQPRNLEIIKPVSYAEMMDIYREASLILTDSGGIQEEACYLGIPVLLFRHKTERIESINSGISRYINEESIDLEAFIHEQLSLKPADSNTLYGAGNASRMIVDYLVPDSLPVI